MRQLKIGHNGRWRLRITGEHGEGYRDVLLLTIGSIPAGLLGTLALLARRRRRRSGEPAGRSVADELDDLEEQAAIEVTDVHKEAQVTTIAARVLAEEAHVAESHLTAARRSASTGLAALFLTQ